MKARAGSSDRTFRWGQIALLLLALALRVILAAQGGQSFWPDEDRYRASKNAVYDFENGQTVAGWKELIGHADHLFFKIAGLAPAWAESKWGPHPVWPAVYFGFFSVLAIGLLGRIARSAGGSEREAFLAVFFGCGAASLFYYSRHYFPYDLSLALCLCGLWVSFRFNGYLAALGVGLCEGLGFLTYNGYWILGAVVLIAYLGRAQRWRTAVGLALMAAAGLVLPLILAVVAARGVGVDLIASFQEFSRTIAQGDFGQGFRFVPEFLWVSDGLPLVGLTGAMLLGGWKLPDSQTRFRVRRWTMLAAGIYLGLVLCSDVAHFFVIYGRIARLVVPFICLAAAAAVAEGINRGRSRGLITIGLVAFVAGASFQFAGLLGQEFPPQFALRGAAEIARRSSTDLAVIRPLNLRNLRPGEPVDSAAGPRTILLQHAHPLEYRPYLFEGFDREQRRYLQTHAPTMQFVALPVSGKGYGPYPGAIELEVKLPSYRHNGVDPIFTAGVGDQAEFVVVWWADPGHVRFGYVRSGEIPTYGDLLPVDVAISHRILVSLGAQFPPVAPLEPTSETRDLNRLRHFLVVAMDGKVALVGRVQTSARAVPRFLIGQNDLVGSVGVASFTGKIISARHVPLPEISQFLPEKFSPSPDLTRDWSGYWGPIQLQLKLTEAPTAGDEPLLSTGEITSPVILFLRRESSSRARIGLARGADRSELSLPFVIPNDGRLTLTISLGDLYPPMDPAAPRPIPELAALRERLEVWVDNEKVLSRKMERVTSDPTPVSMGENYFWQSAISPRLSGGVESVRSLKPEEILTRMASSTMAGLKGDAALNGYPGAIEIILTPPHLPGPAAEPLLVTGKTGAGDIVYLRYAAPGKIRIGFDHWGAGGPESEDFSIGEKVTLVISHGALYPSMASEFFAQHPEMGALKNWLLVLADGKVVLARLAKTHPATPAQIEVGNNFIGGSTTSEKFAGEILSLRPISPAEVWRRIKSNEERQ